MLAYSINAIHLKRGDKVVVQAPKEVFECASQKQFDELLALGAIREPNDAERALFGLANPVAPVAAPEPKVETRAERKLRERAEAPAPEAEVVEAPAPEAEVVETLED